jgi:hypothetical protein
MPSNWYWHYGIVAGICYFVSHSAVFAEQYLCIPDKNTGFKYNRSTKEWEYARFVTDQKYIIAPSTDKQYSYMVTELGAKCPLALCKEDFNPVGFLFCGQLEMNWRFNKVNLHYHLISDGGYVSDGLPNIAEGGFGGLWVQIGKCSPF